MNKLPLLLPIILLSGCSWFGFGPEEVEPVKVENRVRPIPVFHPPLPEAVSWQQVEWKVLTPEIMRQYLEDLDAGDAPTLVYYGLTPEGYRALSENVGDIQRYIAQSKSLILYYRENLVEVVVEQVEAEDAAEEAPEETQ